MSSARCKTVLEGATVALKLAHAATDVIPLVGQILGSAAHISEFVETLQKRRDEMYELAERSTIYALQIKEILAREEHAVDDSSLRRLQRLLSVFSRIEAFMRKESSVKGRIKRALRSAFVAPNKAAQLAVELEREIQLFQLAMSVETRLLAHGSALYDGEARRYSKASDTCSPRDGWLRRHLGDCASRRQGFELPSRINEYVERVKKISMVHNSHRNVVQLYGRHYAYQQPAFAVFRAGVGDGFGYFQHTKTLSPGDRALKELYVVHKIIDAARHLTEEHNLVWIPKLNGSPVQYISVDSDGEPTIGLYDEIEDVSQWESAARAMKRLYFEIVDLMTSTGDCCRGDMCTPISSRELRQTLDSLVPDCHDGRLRALLERLHIQAAEPGLQHGMRSFPFPFDNASLPPTLLLRTRRFHHQVLQASAKTPDAGLEILTLRGSLERWVLLSYAPSDPQSLLILEEE